MWVVTSDGGVGDVEFFLNGQNFNENVPRIQIILLFIVVFFFHFQILRLRLVAATVGCFPWTTILLSDHVIILKVKATKTPKCCNWPCNQEVPHFWDRVRYPVKDRVSWLKASMENYCSLCKLNFWRVLFVFLQHNYMKVEMSRSTTMQFPNRIFITNF